MVGLVWTAMDQFDIPHEVMLDLFLATAVGAGLVILAAGLAAALLIGLRKWLSRRRD
jgi:hypothetical protein